MKKSNGVKKIGLVMAVLMVAGMAGAFASTIWTSAEDLAADSSALVPTYTTIHYAETTEDGMQLIQEQALIIHGENASDELTRREVGEDDVFAVISSFTDGMVFTPFADAVEDLEYEATGEVKLIDGVTAVEYEFDLTVDDSQIKYAIDEGNGTAIDVSGSVWISERDGSVVKVDQEYSLYSSSTGAIAIEQEIYFDYNGESLLPTQTITSGAQVYTDENKMEMRTDFTLVETYSQFFEASSYVR